MKLVSINVSLASFQMSKVELMYLDPYNNTLGEDNWIVIFLVIILCLCSSCVICLSLGVLMFERNGLNSENRRLLDMLLSFGMIIVIVTVVPSTILMVQRNVFGPLQNENFVYGLLSIQTFGKIYTMMLMIVLVLSWYMIEMVFKNQCQMDEVGIAECIIFFIFSLSAGLTFLVSIVENGFHQKCIRYLGLPLDKPEYIINTR